VVNIENPDGEALQQAVRLANRNVFNRQSLDHYESNEGVFNAKRQTRLKGILGDARAKTGDGILLDLGCGTGNVMRLASGVYSSVIGLDLAENLLSQAARRDGSILVAADALHLPFASGSFACVAANALLHHIANPAPVFLEVFRVLRPGGIFITDHDPNWHCGRFRSGIRKGRRLGEHGFGSSEADLSEYHHSVTGGLKPDELVEAAYRAGFTSVRADLYTDIGSWQPLKLRIVLFGGRILGALSRARIFFTHVRITATR